MSHEEYERLRERVECLEGHVELLIKVHPKQPKGVKMKISKKCPKCDGKGEVSIPLIRMNREALEIFKTFGEYFKDGNGTHHFLPDPNDEKKYVFLGIPIEIIGDDLNSIGSLLTDIDIEKIKIILKKFIKNNNVACAKPPHLITFETETEMYEITDYKIKRKPKKK